MLRKRQILAYRNTRGPVVFLRLALEPQAQKKQIYSVGVNAIYKANTNSEMPVFTVRTLLSGREYRVEKNVELNASGIGLAPEIGHVAKFSP